tara:strand:- start:912 stop:1403 length:492 start_codon:yes stop_codon:yes gene_type:complete
MTDILAPPSKIYRCNTVSQECVGCNNLFQQHYSDFDITFDKQLCITCINNRYDGRIFQKKLLSLNDDNTPKIYFGIESDGSTIYLNSFSDPDLSKSSTINCVKNILKRNNFVFSQEDVFISLDHNKYLRMYFRNGEDLFIVKRIDHLEENYPGIGLLNTNEIN